MKHKMRIGCSKNLSYFVARCVLFLRIYKIGDLCVFKILIIYFHFHMALGKRESGFNTLIVNNIDIIFIKSVALHYKKDIY